VAVCEVKLVALDFFSGNISAKEIQVA